MEGNKFNNNNKKKENKKEKEWSPIVKNHANFHGDIFELFMEKFKDPKFLNATIEMLVDDNFNSQEEKEMNSEKVEKMRKRFKEKILFKIKHRTKSVNIEFNSKNYFYDPDTDKITIGDLYPEGDLYHELENKKASNFLKEIILIHEFGHLVRSPLINYNKKSIFAKKISSGFDESKMITYNKQLYYLLRKKNPTSNINFSKFCNINKTYNLHKSELFERMAQLRNYFGMKYGDIFTKEHLDYVRKNYSKDTEFYHQIRPFLLMITEKTEENFLKNMNEFPI